MPFQVPPEKVPLVTVPEKVGVVIVGEVAKTATPVPVSSVSEAASAAEAAVVVAFDEASVKRARDAVRDEKVTAPERVGVAMVGEVPKTATPVPVSSVRAVRRLAEVNDPSDAALPTEVMAPVKLALVVTLPAVRPEAVPVRLVATPDDGVPRAPPFVTNEPAEPTLTASAVPTPVPRPVIPAIGRPVPLVKVTADGVPKFGVVKTGLVVYATNPVPLSSVRMVAKLAEVSVPK